MSKLLKITVIAAAALFASVSFAGKIKVACVGDSITYGYGIKDGTKTAAGCTRMLFSTVMRPSNRICCK